jgi:D-glycero-D-manno-heptose 1,7-bisphosphate phosphatase
MTSGAVFLDRDGTINEEMGYINHPSRFVIFPFVAASIKIINQLGLKVIIVTNQSGIARGYFNEELVQDIHVHLISEMKLAGAKIDDIYYCPHHPQSSNKKFGIECHCRKPKPGMIQKAIQDHNLDLEQSYMVGDRYKDIVFARNLKIRSGFVLTGYGRGEYEFQKTQWEYMPDIIGENLLEVINKIEVEVKNK